MSEELDTLKRKLAARQNDPAYKTNCEALSARIAELEAIEKEESDDQDA